MKTETKKIKHTKKPTVIDVRRVIYPTVKSIKAKTK